MVARQPGKSVESIRQLPVEGLWTLDDAVEMIPFPSKGALYQFLNQHPEIPRRYRRAGGQKAARWGFVQRFLSDSEIRQIRAMTINEEAGYRFFRGVGRGRPAQARSRYTKEQDSMIAWITQAANG